MSEMIYNRWNLSEEYGIERGPKECNSRCDAAFALSTTSDGRMVWECLCGNWVVPRPNNMSMPSFFNDGVMQELFMAEETGRLWGDIILDWEDAERAKETTEQKAARLAESVLQTQKMMDGVIDYSVAKKAERWCDKTGEMKFRVPRPCKYETLFLEGREEKGCWMHSKGEPCIYIHPDQEQWKDAVAGRLCYDRDSQAFYLKGQPTPKPSKARLLEMEKERSQNRPHPKSKPQQNQSVRTFQMGNTKATDDWSSFRRM
jgi:hypothetical protein